jgi:3-dehydroquinate synthase
MIKQGFDVAKFLMPDGERYKTLRTAENLLAEMSRNGISRTDVVVGLGGGVVGDLAGFAAAVHLRGIRFFLIPTTLLAMVDASVGGKTGVNTSVGKNLIGTFHQPAGVLVDVDVLATLPAREVASGYCEMVKHAILEGPELFEITAKYLTDANGNFRSEISNLVTRNIEFKADVVAGDEREAVGETGERSRKILNLGHTLGHALEKVTNYRKLRHGEAVGHGLIFAAKLSNSLDLLNKESVNLINDVVHRTGLRSVPPGIEIDELLSAFSSDKKVIGGSLQMILLKGIGKPVIHTFDRIPHAMFKSVAKAVLQ